MKNTLHFVCLLVYLLSIPVKSLDIECVYHAGDFSHSLKGPSNYWCRVNSMNLISRQDLIVNNITGSHLSNKINDNVRAFQVYTGTSFFCLKGIENFFKNLIGLAYQECSLKEIHREDLKPFPNIVDLYLNNNDIEVIEEGLLDFNTELVLVYLVSNKITQIHANVFDHLGKMTHLYLSSNTCAVKDSTDQVATKALIKQIKSDNLCQNGEFMNIEAKLRILENNLNPMNSSTFKDQFEKLKNDFKFSKYSKYSAFDDRLENLRIAVYGKICKNSNVTNLTEELPEEDKNPLRLEDFSSFDGNNYKTDDNFGDFQRKIDALSAKVSSIAEIVEKLEDKLEKMFKNINFKVTVDV